MRARETPPYSARTARSGSLPSPGTTPPAHWYSPAAGGNSLNFRKSIVFSHADGVNSDATILQYNSSDPSTDPGPDSFNGYPAKLDRYVSQSIYLLAFRAKIKR